MRCQDCGKFVAYDGPNAEMVTELLENVTVTTDGQENVHVEADYSAEVRVVLCCAECGGELKEAILEIGGGVDLTHDCTGTVEAMKDAGDDLFELDEATAEGTDRSDGEGRPSRYRRTFYGAEVTPSITCTICKQDVSTESFSDDVQASSMDELV